MASQIVNPYQNFMGLNAVPIQNGYIYIGVENQDPESYPIAVYWDNGLTIPASQPIRTIGGYYSNGGTPGQLFAAGRYSIRVKDSTGTQVFYSASSQFAGAYLSLTGGDMTGAINWAKATDIPSAALTDIASAAGNYVVVTGTTTITALGTAQAGAFRLVKFSGALTLTYNATSLVLPGAANIITTAGDVAGFVSEGSGNWTCVFYTKTDGTAVVSNKIPVRQTVMSGAVDANGYANILSTGSGLTPTLLATATAVRVAFAAGFNSAGADDFVGQVSSGTNFPACVGSQTVSSATNATSCVITTAAAHGLSVGTWVTPSGFTPTGYNGTYQITAVTPTTFTITLAAAPGATTVIGSYTVTNFLYVDRNTSTGALTLGATVLPPNYQYTTASVTSGQHTFVLPDMKMYVGNGATAAAVQRVFVGEANASAAAISSVVSYAFNGIYDSGAVNTPAISTRFSANANIGRGVPVVPSVYAKCIAADQGYSPGDIVFSPASSNGSYAIPYQTTVSGNAVSYAAQNSGAFTITPYAAGANVAATPASWRVGVQVKRAF